MMGFVSGLGRPPGRPFFWLVSVGVAPRLAARRRSRPGSCGNLGFCWWQRGGPVL